MGFSTFVNVISRTIKLSFKRLYGMNNTKLKLKQSLKLEIKSQINKTIKF